MIEALVVVIKIVWTVSVVGLATVVGTVLGWALHGWLGAIVFGILGSGVGAFVAGHPELLLEILAQ